MSPTMTEGGIAGWRKKEGETFTAGDVLLEIVRVSAASSISVFQRSEIKGNLSVARGILGGLELSIMIRKIDEGAFNADEAEDAEDAELISRKQIKQQ